MLGEMADRRSISMVIVTDLYFSFQDGRFFDRGSESSGPRVQYHPNSIAVHIRPLIAKKLPY